MLEHWKAFTETKGGGGVCREIGRNLTLGKKICVALEWSRRSGMSPRSWSSSAASRARIGGHHERTMGNWMQLGAYSTLTSTLTSTTASIRRGPRGNLSEIRPRRMSWLRYSKSALREPICLPFGPAVGGWILVPEESKAPLVGPEFAAKAVGGG